MAVSCNSNSTTVAPAFEDTLFRCLPCGAACDTVTHTRSGVCSHCGMNLVPATSIRHGNLQPFELCAFIHEKGAANIRLLDVRTPEEFNGTVPGSVGHLKGAINIPVQALEQRLHEIKSDTGKYIIVYCRHSHRSPRASYLLSQNGFRHVFNMQQGMSQWKSLVANDSCNRNLYIQP